MSTIINLSAQDKSTYDHVLEHLREKHIRITDTRKAVIAYMIQTHEHPSAETIYHDLLPEHPSMSLATVYNNLKVLIEEGFVSEIKVSNDNTTYFDFLGHQHVNVICEVCGKITDWMDVDIPSLTRSAQAETGYSITKASLVVYGICPECHAEKEQGAAS